MITKEYQRALVALRNNYTWGNSAGKYAGETVFALLKEHPEIETILDYGCGNGTLKEYIEEEGITDRKWTLYDPGIEELNELPTGKFDLVITTDVLEHVEEIMLNKVINNLRELTGRFLYSEIACYYSGIVFADGPYPGEDLHINMKCPDVWQMRLQHRDFDVQSYVVSLIEGWKVRALVIQERKNK